MQESFVVPREQNAKGKWIYTKLSLTFGKFQPGFYTITIKLQYPNHLDRVQEIYLSHAKTFDSHVYWLRINSSIMFMWNVRSRNLETLPVC